MSVPEWEQVAKLLGDGLDTSHRFGHAVAQSGDTTAVGAYNSADGGTVYVFERDQGGTDAWGQVTVLTG
ncbi:MAG: FG-GAP repeat protein, partial [Acidobacteriota bacterium]